MERDLISAARVSRWLTRAGCHVLPEITTEGEGVRVLDSAIPGVVYVSVDIDSPGLAGERYKQVGAILTSLGYAIEEIGETLLSVTRGEQGQVGVTRRASQAEAYQAIREAYRKGAITTMQFLEAQSAWNAATDLPVFDTSRKMGPDAARAVGRFNEGGPDGYKAATAPDAPLRATREEAVEDERAWLDSRDGVAAT